jgi:hypothetical protein
MNQQRPPSQQQQLGQRLQSQAPTQSRSTPTPAVELPRMDVAAPAKPAGPPTNLSIDPTPADANDASLSFEWHTVTLGSNQTFGCTISIASGESLSVRIEQPPYEKAVRGDGTVELAVIPVAALGTHGRLIATNEVSGATAEFTWQWQPPGKKGAKSSAAVAGAKMLKRAVPASGRSHSTVKAAQDSRSNSVVQGSTAFFGQQAIGRRFAFILDMSGSMDGGRWRTCTSELVSALNGLSSEMEFFVVLFSSQLSEPPGQTGWTKATPDNVSAVVNWVGTIRPEGGTYPAPAFDRVFSLGGRPDALYFLTDGQLEGFTPADCARVCTSGSSSKLGAALRAVGKFFSFSGGNSDQGTVVNTIALDDPSSARALKAMAEASGGQFVQVSSKNVTG